jgi:hypothetical protein
MNDHRLPPLSSPDGPVILEGAVGALKGAPQAVADNPEYVKDDPNHRVTRQAETIASQVANQDCTPSPLKDQRASRSAQTAAPRRMARSD